MRQRKETRLHSLVGMEVELLSIDGVRVGNSIGQMYIESQAVLEEVSDYGFLFRFPPNLPFTRGGLLFASSATFRICSD